MRNSEEVGKVSVEVGAEGALDSEGEGLGRRGPEVEDAEPEGERESCTGRSAGLEVNFV